MGPTSRKPPQLILFMNPVLTTFDLSEMCMIHIAPPHIVSTSGPSHWYLVGSWQGMYSLYSMGHMFIPDSGIVSGDFLVIVVVPDLTDKDWSKVLLTDEVKDYVVDKYGTDWAYDEQKIDIILEDLWQKANNEPEVAKGEMASEAKRSLDKSSEGSEEVFPGEAGK
ncbi:hypothetical protein Tco_0988985 [Tanacetum coccineum]|uniref:Uncharacterized protein n=1 Tax=Tanacetum coccineum TaxID=301880 RepID=A0ABQ5ESD9_9ASTR